jgi:tripartite ATP-independent transporter DctM subunit
MSIGILTLILFSTLLLCLLSGFPIAFGLGGVAVIYSLILWGPQSLLISSYAAYDTLWNFLLVAIPLFILMGNVLAKSGIGEALFSAVYLWLGSLRGGLAITLVVVAALMGAMVGVIGASIITLGLVAIPAMKKRGYDEQLILGTLMAGGALASLIPPSCAMLVYGALTEVSVGQMFMGGVIPGLLLAALYIIYIFVRTSLNPKLAPAMPFEERVNFKQKVFALKGVILPIAIILAVIGSIFFGVATPTEAASIGAVGAFVAAAVNHRLSGQIVKESLLDTAKLVGMVVWILVGANLFSRFYLAMGASHLIENLVLGLQVSPFWVVIMMQVILIVMGMFMEDWALIMICAPIFSPIVVALGFDPLWFSIIFIINMQLAVLTPPYGFCLFYAKALVPDKGMMLLWRSIIPFIPLQIAGLALSMLFPKLILWLPSLMFKVQ